MLSINVVRTKTFRKDCRTSIKTVGRIELERKESYEEAVNLAWVLSPVPPGFRREGSKRYEDILGRNFLFEFIDVEYPKEVE